MPSSSLRAEVKMTPDDLSFADSARLGRKILRVMFTVPSSKVSPKDLVQQRVQHKARNADEINARLAEISRRVESLHRGFLEQGVMPTREKLREMLLGATRPALQERTLSEDYALFIEHLENSGVGGKYTSDAARVKRIFTAYLKQRKFSDAYESISTPCLSGFEAHIWKIPRITRQNTVAKYLEHLKHFLNFALSEKWTNNDIHKKYYIQQETNPFPTVLSEEEIEKVHRANLAAMYNYRRLGAAEITRDLFVFACETGIRYGDWGKGEIIAAKAGGYNIRMSQAKTSTPLEIPLSNRALEIARKYNFSLPTPLTPTSTLIYIKEIAAAAGVKKHITTHTARRTCATQFETAGVPRALIMRITGHKTEKEYLKYIGVTFEANADLIRAALPAKFQPAVKTA